MCVANRSELTADALRQQLRQQLTDSEIAEIERAAWQQVFEELAETAGNGGHRSLRFQAVGTQSDS